jgi:hypothetical protein
LENAGWVGVEIVRTRVPFRRLIPRFVRAGRMSLSAPWRRHSAVRIFLGKHMLMIRLKKPAAGAAGQG